MPTSKRKYEEEESEVFHVEVITKARVALPFSDEEDEDGQGQVRRKKGKSKRAKKAKWEYFVKWANYDSDANSWEPEENVAGCQRLLASFWDHVGTDNGDYDVGYEVAAQEKWIKKEKRYFSQEYEEAQENLRKKREKDGRNGRKKTKKKSITGKSRTNSLAADLNDNSTDKKPLLPAKRKFNSETSEDDIPLSKLPPRKTTKTNTATAVVIDSEPSNEQRNRVSESEEPTGSLFSSPEPEPAPTVPAPPRPPPRPLPGVKQTPIPPKPIYPDNAVEPSPENTASGKGLSTKQRLSQRALDALPLKANRLPATKHKQLPLPRNPSSSMFPLGFKKKTMSTPVPIGGSLDKTTPPIPSYEQPNVAFSHQNQIERLQQPILPPSNDAHMEAADAFLRNIMPPDLAGPLEPAVEHPFEREPPKALPKQLSAPKILQPPWTWSGDVFTDTEQSELGFGVTFCDVTLTTFIRGLRFNVVLAAVDRLDFSSFHDAVDLNIILAACQGVHQFARLGPRRNSDIESLQIFSAYMAKMQKVILFPAHLDDLVVGHIVFFHHDTAVITARLKPPFEIQRDGSLVAALVPWSLASNQLLRHHRNSPSSYLPLHLNLEPLLKEASQWRRTLQSKPFYHHGLRILEFPRPLYKYLSEDGHVRTFSLWFDGADGTKQAGLESTALLKVLEKCRTRRTRITEAPRLLFLHIGTVKSIHKLPGLLDFVASSLVQFYTYGTHETVTPEFWGVREIFPCGGIVTFTPQALLDDPIGILHRIRQIHSHPMWECYILPSVFGMVAKVHSQRTTSDAVADFDSGKFPYTQLLGAIDDGECSLISSPPVFESSTKDRDTHWQEWLQHHWTHRPQGPRAVLQTCLDNFHSKYGASQPSNWTPAIIEEISKDLRGMRSQPAFMGKYRRYIVIDNATHVTKRNDALEWTTTVKLDFMDDFFPAQA